MNLTFEVDSHASGTYQHLGQASATGFRPNTMVFSKTGMTEAPHSLTIQIGPDSVLLLDYIVYTQGAVEDGEGSSTSVVGSTSSTAPEAQRSASGTGSPASTDGPGDTNLCV